MKTVRNMTALHDRRPEIAGRFPANADLIGNYSSTFYSKGTGGFFSFVNRFWGMLHSYEINPYPTAFPYGNGMVLHYYQQQESSTTKTVHRVINKGLKAYV